MYATRGGAPAAREANQLKVSNPYFNKDTKLPTNTTNLMPHQLQKRGKGGHKGFGVQSEGKGKGMMTKAHEDGFLSDMMTPMGLNSLSDVQQYRKLVEMRNQDIMQKREDEVLRQYQHVTQGLRDDQKDRVLTATGVARDTLPGDASDFERSVHRSVMQHGKRSKRDLEVAGAHVAGKPYIPRRGAAGGYVISGQEPVGARVENVILRHPRRRAKGGGKGA